MMFDGSQRRKPGQEGRGGSCPRILSFKPPTHDDHDDDDDDDDDVSIGGCCGDSDDHNTDTGLR